LWTGTGSQQSLDDLDMSALGGQVQGRETVMAGGFEIVAGLESCAKLIQIAQAGGPEQWDFALRRCITAEQSTQQGRGH
jgi:hypothetical protein